MQAEENPDGPLIIFEGQRISYSQFNRESNRYADFFQRQGFQKGDVVGLFMRNCPAYLCIVTGLSKLGVITALINVSVRGEVLAHDINLSDARALIIGHELLEHITIISGRIRLKTPARIFVKNVPKSAEIPVGMADLALSLLDASEENPHTTSLVNSEDILVYMYTSGSAGLRKAVPVLQKRWLMVGHQMSAYADMTAKNIIYVTVPLHFNSGFNVCFAGTIIAGASMLLKTQFSTHKFWNDIRDYAVSHFVSVDEMCRYIYEQAPQEDDRENTLHCIISNGMTADLIEPFQKRFNIAHIIEIYGTTEGVGSFVNIEEIPGMCGQLTLDGVRQGEVVRYDFDSAQLIYDENNRLVKCQPGETGMLLGEINELNSFAGYINDSETTEAKLIYNVFREGDSYYRSDDLVKLHQNDHISFVQRLGETYRWKGQTVSAEAVADVIAKFFGSIEEVIVFGVSVPGYGGRCGLAVLRLIDGEKLDWVNLTRHIGSRMPEYARPNFIRIFGKDYPDQELEDIKRDLQLEGYYPGLINDPLYYYDEQKNAYLPLTAEIYRLIMEEKVRF